MKPGTVYLPEDCYTCLRSPHCSLKLYVLLLPSTTPGKSPMTPQPTSWRKSLVPPLKTGSFRLATFLSLPLALLAALVLSSPGRAQTGIPNVVVSNPSIPIEDNEYDQLGARQTYIDQSGFVWIGGVDPNTGNLVPPSGQVTLVDGTGTALPVPAIGNGSEWLYGGSYGPQLVWTAVNKNGKKVLGRAYKNGSTWVSGFLANSAGRELPIPSKDVNDASPRLLYLGPDAVRGRGTALYWRNLDATTDEQVPGQLNTGGRWIPGQRAMVFTTIDVRSGFRQVATYNVDTKQLTILTNTPCNKDSPWIFQAPEFNNDYTMMVTCQGNPPGPTATYSTMEVYRQTNGVWTLVNNIQVPSTNKYIASPEPWFYKNKSYFSAVVSPNPDNLNGTDPTEIWIATLDPAAPFFQMVSDTTPNARKDPEVFITTQGPVVYYNAPAVSGQLPAVWKATPVIPGS